MEGIIISTAFFGSIFGIVYVFLTTRNKERLSLIEKGADASLFEYKSTKFSLSKFILNIALLFVGIGIGIFCGGFLHEVIGIGKDIAMPSTIFIFGGLGLIVGFFITRKLDKADND